MIIRKSIVIFLLTLLVGQISFGHTDSTDTKYLSIGSKTSGISFGHSNIYNGLRFNLWDKELNSKQGGLRQMNGVNFSFRAISEQTNGIQIGVLACDATKMNGLSIASVAQNTNKINGLAASFMIDSITLNGVFIGFGVSPSNRNIDGRVINGLALGVIVGAEDLNGGAIGLFNVYSEQQNGISISALNETEQLHGLQIGFLNYAGNNPKPFRWLPLINFHL